MASTEKESRCSPWRAPAFFFCRRHPLDFAPEMVYNAGSILPKQRGVAQLVRACFGSVNKLLSIEKSKVRKSFYLCGFSALCKISKMRKNRVWPQFVPLPRKNNKNWIDIRVWRSWERGWFGTIRPQVRSLSLGPKRLRNQCSWAFSQYMRADGNRLPSLCMIIQTNWNLFIWAIYRLAH